MGIETLLAVVGGSVGGIVIGHTVVLLAYSTAGYFKYCREIREQGNEIAQEWDLPKKYNLKTEELALLKVRELAKLIKAPYDFDNCSDKIVGVFKEYRHDIKEQSGDLEDPTKTEALKLFLADKRTKEWLVDPLYVTSDREYKKSTSYLELILSPYKAIIRKIGNIVSKREPSPVILHGYKLDS